MTKLNGCRFSLAVLATSLLFIALPNMSMSQEAHNCECRAAGRQWAQGEKTCLNGNLYVCDMNQNITSWTRTGETCPSANLSTPVGTKKNPTLMFQRRVS